MTGTGVAEERPGDSQINVGPSGFFLTAAVDHAANWAADASSFLIIDLRTIRAFLSV